MREERCVDIIQLGDRISDLLQLGLEDSQKESLGNILICFGEVDYL